MQVELKTIGFKEVERILGDMHKKAPSVLFNVINRVTSNIRKNLSKKVLKRYGIKSAEVKKTVKTKRASKSNPSAYVSSSGEALPLIKFKVKPTDVISQKLIKIKDRKSVKGKVLKSQKLKVIRHAFVQKMPSGHIGVFRRKLISENLKKMAGNSAIKKTIHELHGPSVPQMVANEEVMKRILTEATETYNKRLEHEIKRILGK